MKPDWVDQTLELVWQIIVIFVSSALVYYVLVDWLKVSSTFAIFFGVTISVVLLTLVSKGTNANIQRTNDTLEELQDKIDQIGWGIDDIKESLKKKK